MLRRTPYTHGESPAVLSALHDKRSWGEGIANNYQERLRRLRRAWCGRAPAVHTATATRSAATAAGCGQAKPSKAKLSKAGGGLAKSTHGTNHNAGPPLFQPGRVLSCSLLPHQRTTLAPKMTMGRTRHAGVCLVLAALTTVVVIPGVGAFGGGLRVAITQQPHDCSIAASSSTVSPRSLNPAGVCVRSRLSIDLGGRLHFTTVVSVPYVCFEKAGIAYIAIGLPRGLPLGSWLHLLCCGRTSSLDRRMFPPIPKLNVCVSMT